ncbi:MAG TPA: GIDE domain-containing protein, partial [bacterium]|nr:GIDE domain-containing protein [bacterium]
EKCVYYQYLIEQYVNSGKNSHWETILKGDSKENPFFMQDETGTVMVAPEGSKAVIPDDYRLETGLFTDVPPHIEAFMGRNGLSCRGFFGFEKKLRFTEHNLKPTEQVFVMGTCQETAALPASPPAEASPGVCLTKGQRSGDVFILSDESQRDLVSSYGWHAFFGIFGGLILIGGCLYGLLTLLGMA